VDEVQANPVIRSEMEPKEKLRWSGSPRSGLRLSCLDAYIVPCSLVYCGFGIFWEYQAFQGGTNLISVLLDLPILLSGVYFLVGRFFVDAWQRRRTFYGLTDQRVVIVSGLFRRQVRSMSLQTLGKLTLAEKIDRSETITFGSGDPMLALMAGTSWPAIRRITPPSFDMIENARDVYEQVRSAQHAAMIVSPRDAD